MAHSIQEYRGRNEIINDLDIAMIGTVIINIVQQSKLEYFFPMVKSWKASLDFYGPGTIDLDLEYFIINEEMRLRLDKLFDQTSEIIATRSVFSIHDIGDISYQPKFIKLENYPSKILINAVNQLKWLIEPPTSQP
jgi:hypothetical protein